MVVKVNEVFGGGSNGDCVELMRHCLLLGLNSELCLRFCVNDEHILVNV